MLNNINRHGHYGNQFPSITHAPQILSQPQSRPQSFSLDREREELWGTLKQSVFSLVFVKNKQKRL